MYARRSGGRVADEAGRHIVVLGLLTEHEERRLDTALRQPLKQAARIVSEDAPADWLFGYRVTVARGKNLHGFPGKLTQILLPLWQVYKTK